jgi:hypothetical protein
MGAPMRTAAAIIFILLGMLMTVSSPFAQQPQPSQQRLSDGELDALLAPIALYPDALLSKILIASTFPDQVRDAAAWQKANPNLTDGALEGALSGRSWNDNIKALAHIPGVLAMMNDQRDWSYALGGVFVSQQDDVMASVQRLRRQAQAAGTLQSTTQQQVVTQGDSIVIQPTQPSMVYVPYYNPTVVYGSWLYPTYPPYYWAAPAGAAFAGGLAWGAGFAISAAIWSNAFDWHNHNVWYGGGWYAHGGWNHGYYNNWQNHNNWHYSNFRNNNFHNNNVNIHNNVNINRDGNRTNNFNNNRGNGGLNGNRGGNGQFSNNNRSNNLNNNRAPANPPNRGNNLAGPQAGHGQGARPNAGRARPNRGRINH